jgi:hypothetical protein
MTTTQAPMHPEPAIAAATSRAEGAAREASPLITALGRLGFACKGVVYLVIGVLAGQLALGQGGETTDAQGVLVRVLDAPFGKLGLGVVAVGLAGYVLWRLVQAVLDPDGKGTDAKGLWARAGYLVSAVIHSALAVAAIRLLLGTGGSGSGDQSAQSWTARLLEQPYGAVLVMLAGVAMLGSAAFQFYRAYKADFRKELRNDQMGPGEQKFASRTGRLGHAARGVTFGVIGIFLLVAAAQRDPAEARGLAGALETLVQQPYGPYILGLVAAGLVAYGLYMFVEARFRRMVV